MINFKNLTIHTATETLKIWPPFFGLITQAFYFDLYHLNSLISLAHIILSGLSMHFIVD